VTAVYGLTSKRVRRIEVELTSHRRVNAAIRLFGHNRLFLALLPRRVAVRSVRFVGVKGGFGVKTALYSPRRQCGYTFQRYP
jgi:hypothetical protein